MYKPLALAHKRKVHFSKCFSLPEQQCFGLEKVLLKKQVTKRTSTTLTPGKKLWVLAKGSSAPSPPPSLLLPFCFEAPSSKRSKSRLGAATRRAAVHPAGVLSQTTLCGPWAPLLLFGVLSSPLLPSVGSTRFLESHQ